MTPRFTGGLVAIAFAVGILTGSAATIVVRDATGPDHAAVMDDHMADMDGMSSMMTGGTPPASLMPGSSHDEHHPQATP